ncbi:MAG: hypothetical protein ACPL3A_06535 [Thermoanaerobacteraceae bacterium]
MLFYNPSYSYSEVHNKDREKIDENNILDMVKYDMVLKRKILVI